ncbi:hypothetical protein ACSAZK_03740 [Methanosarcina sp. Mfa9]|uniref:hypothetical protein n=1 Tax=Methanosarcina sp. Mfa9 TaxID=3439063 RepID=UPI003F83E383
MPDSNPDETLNELKDELKTIEIEIDNRNKRKEELKKDITELESIKKEIEKIVNNYKNVSSNFEQDKSDFENYAKTKKPMIEGVIEDSKKEAVDGIKNEVEEKITETKSITDNLAEDITAVNESFQDAQVFLKEKQDSFDSLKNYQKEIQMKFQNLNELRKSIEKYDESSDVEEMYFLILELENNLSKATIKTPVALESDLSNKWDEMYTAKENLRNKESALKTAQNNYEIKKQELESLKKNRSAEIMEKIGEL